MAWGRSTKTSTALPGVRIETPLSKTAQRAVPTIAHPSPDQRKGNFRTLTFTYTTTAGAVEKVLYTADIPWARVKLLLQTAGPVGVSTSQNFGPIASGKGITLDTGVEREITIARGNRLYIASPTVNRVSVIIEPLPWLEQMLGGILQGFEGLGALIHQISQLGGRK